MPFMKGVAPIRRTKAYLDAGKLIFHDQIKVLTVNYNLDQKSSSGAYEFVFWHFPQIKYKNGALQLLKFKNMTPTPCIQILCDNGKKHVVDIYGRSRQEIHDHLLDAFCRPEKSKSTMSSLGSFGYKSRHWCICEMPGQVPCPGFQTLPDNMRGKFIIKKYQEEKEAQENS